MLDAPTFLTVPEQLTAVIPLQIARSEIQHVMGPGIQEIYAALGAQGIAPAGPWLTHHFHITPDAFDFEIAVPVAQMVTAAGRVQAGSLPAGRVARTLYRGPYEGLGAAWGQFKAQLARDGKQTTEAIWESYLVGPESTQDAAGYVTELTQPLVG
jgi:effector-binding domain-containing protein